MIEPRSYRDLSHDHRFVRFTLRAGETDLLAGIASDAWDASRLPDFVGRVTRAREELVRHVARRPVFGLSWEPLPDDPLAPEVARAMLAAARDAGTGPMAAVAGAVADIALDAALETWRAREAFVENGGDCAILVEDAFVVSIGAPTSVADGSVGLVLSAGRWGIATSAGRAGHSRSMGASDACSIAFGPRSAPDASGRRDDALGLAARADAWATRLGNALGRPEDVERALGLAPDDAAAVFCLMGSKGGYRGYLAPVALRPRRRAASPALPALGRRSP